MELKQLVRKSQREPFQAMEQLLQQRTDNIWPLVPQHYTLSAIHRWKERRVQLVIEQKLGLFSLLILIKYMTEL
jgi:hypothetical protein